MSDLAIKPCVVCKKDLKSIFPKEHENDSSYIQPHGGITFFGYGSYGSSHDESPEYVVNICDECMTDIINAKETLVHKTQKVQVQHMYVEPEPEA